MLHGMELRAETRTVLLVDDHAAFRAIAREVLEQDAAVVEAGSGEEAVPLAASLAPDWVIMDFRMPGMGGLQATREICRNDPSAKVLMLSQFHEPEYATQAHEAGALSFFNKEALPEVLQFITTFPDKRKHAPL